MAPQGKGDAGLCTRAGVSIAKPGSSCLLSYGVTLSSSLSSVLQSQYWWPSTYEAQRFWPVMAAPADAWVGHAAKHSTLLLRKSSSLCQQARTHGRIFPAIASADVKGINIAVCSPQVLWASHYPYAALLPSEKHQHSPPVARSHSYLFQRWGFPLKKPPNKTQTGMWFLGIIPVWHWKMHTPWRADAKGPQFKRAGACVMPRSPSYRCQRCPGCRAAAVSPRVASFIAVFPWPHCTWLCQQKFMG